MTNLLLSTQPGDDSGTLGDVTSSPPIERPRRGPGYGKLWRSLPRELGFLLLTLPIVTVGFSIGWVLFAAGLGTLIIWIGLFILAAALFVARAFGTLELTRLSWAGLPAIARPGWTPVVHRPGLVGWFKDLFSNAHYWLYLLHTVLLGFILGVFTWAVSLVWVAVGLGGVSYWFWGRFLPQSEQDVWLHDVALRFFFPGFQIADSYLGRFNGESVMYAVAGVVFLVTLPWVARGLILLHHGLAVGVLGAFRSEALEREVADLGASRGAAVAAEDHSLRRLERDIHDGPQQRLVRLQFDLASAGRKFESDPGAARALLDGAMQQSRDTLEELRELSRGFAPPILQDRGLAAAIDSLAGRSTVPVTTTVTLIGQTLPPEVERSAYFVVAELLTNVTKHASASRVELTIDSTRAIAGAGNLLSIVVSDDGVGGANAAVGHGLAGLSERIHGLRGSLHLTSPAGGPTVISASIPYQATEGTVS
ncbi:sensor histidine kinase [Microbacterium sp. A94]|uniref:sensor histidine kinase n=1 Tax=Microbacterium sp. A94 TaxID=3450717 RepID=UPI003F443001